MKTVKCPECSAEQEIYVSDGKVVCAFCGAEITELPEDFKMEDFVKEETETVGEDFERNYDDGPKCEGEEIYVEYTLSFDDVKTALETTGKLNRKNTMNIVETVLIAAFFAYEIYGVINQGVKMLTVGNIIMMVIMALLIPVVWVLPRVYEKKYINSIADGTKLFASIYENLIIVQVEGAEKPTIVKLDGSSVLHDTDERFFIVIPNGSVIILPKRFVTEGLDTVTERIVNGTVDAKDAPKTDKK